MKPYYEHGGITIYHGDCREFPSALLRGCTIVSDPPYGVNFDTDYSRFSGGEMGDRRNTHPRVHGDNEPFDPSRWLDFPKVILWGATCYSNRLPMGSWLIWDKRYSNGTALLADAEAAWMNTGHGVYIFDKPWQGCTRTEPIFHPTQKPVVLMEWCIDKANTDTPIVDPYMGSGTTLIAAKNKGREAIGIEIEERYCEIAAKRLSQEAFNFAPAEQHAENTDRG